MIIQINRRFATVAVPPAQIFWNYSKVNILAILVVLKHATTEFYNLSIICMQLKLFKIVCSLLKKTKIGFLQNDLD